MPFGGLSDYKSTWLPPHNTHRVGWDFDVDQSDGSGVTTTCDQDTGLQVALEIVDPSLVKGLFPSPPPGNTIHGEIIRFSCELEGINKHVIVYPNELPGD